MRQTEQPPPETENGRTALVVVGTALICLLGYAVAASGVTDYRELIWRGNRGWARPGSPYLASIRQTLCLQESGGWVHFWPARYGMDCATADDPGDPP